MQLQPYLFFEGRCEEAIAFYQSAIGAELIMLARFRDSPEPGPMATAENADKVMHATIRVGDAVIMVSDGRCGGGPDFKGFGISLIVPDVATTEQLFAKLVEGGTAGMPPAKTFYSPSFGMLTDRFGVMWMIMADQPH